MERSACSSSRLRTYPVVLKWSSHMLEAERQNLIIFSWGKAAEPPALF